MPELPEVETIKKDLSPLVRGKIIEEVVICPDPKGCRLLRRYPSTKQFIRRVKGRKITSLKRRAKYLLFYLDSSDIVIVHLGMSGRFLFLPSGKLLPYHTRSYLRLSGGGRLGLIDPRKFGELYLFSKKSGETKVNPFRLGPEPLAKSFVPAKLRQILGKRKSAIKTALLDQKAIAGLGNIYTDESLFRARIHPLRKSSTLKPAEVEILHAAIRSVLKEAISFRGTTASDGQYLDGRGLEGKFQNRLDVYQRKGESCPRCGTIIETLKIGGRTAHFCPKCQKPR
jgi:formamidopyrimidine-DNA glycosylase